MYPNELQLLQGINPLFLQVLHEAIPVVVVVESLVEVSVEGSSVSQGESCSLDGGVEEISGRSDKVEVQNL